MDIWGQRVTFTQDWELCQPAEATSLSQLLCLYIVN